MGLSRNCAYDVCEPFVGAFNRREYVCEQPDLYDHLEAAKILFPWSPWRIWHPSSKCRNCSLRNVTVLAVVLDKKFIKRLRSHFYSLGPSARPGNCADKAKLSGSKSAQGT